MFYFKTYYIQNRVDTMLDNLLIIIVLPMLYIPPCFLIDSRDLRQVALDSLPNITFSFMKASYGLKFKGVAMQTLVIRRAPNATIGAPWPLPYKYVVNNSLVFIIRKETFKINIRNNSCDVLEKAVERFKENIFKFSLEEYYTNLVNIESSGFFSLDEKYEQLMYTKALDLTTLHIYVNSKCDQYPSVQSDESCK